MFSDKQLKDMILPLLMEYPDLSDNTTAVVFPFADPLGKGLRAAGDAMFTMGISLVTTIGVRLIFWIRFRQGKWKTYRVIGE